MTSLNTQEIIDYIANSKKETPVKVYFNGVIAKIPEGTKRFGNVLFTTLDVWEAIKSDRHNAISDFVVEMDRRNSGVPLLDYSHINARIEPGATIREHVTIGDKAVVMMGAVINIGAVIGEGTMIDMGAVLGGRATTGKNVHVGAGAVLAGVIEPASAQPVVIEDDVLIGANAVVLEGVRVGKGSVVAAGAVVTQDVPSGVVVAGTPARIIKQTSEVENSKIALVDALRQL